MSIKTALGAALAAAAARGSPRPRRRQRAGGIVGLAVGQPAAAGQHRAGDVVRRRDRLRRRRLRHAAEDDATAAQLERPAGRHASRGSPSCRRSTPTPSSRAAAASRGARPTAAATFSAVRFTPVESSCRVGLRGPLVRLRGRRLPAARRRLRLHDDRRRHAVRAAHGRARDARRGRRSPSRAAIAFLDARTGYATSGAKLFQTLDGGVSWRGVASAGRDAQPTSAFADAQHGFARRRRRRVPAHRRRRRTWARESRRSERPEPHVDQLQHRARSASSRPRAGTELIRTGDYGDAGGTVVTPSTDPIYAAALRLAAARRAAGEHGATVVSDDTGVEIRAGRRAHRRRRSRSLRAGGAHGHGVRARRGRRARQDDRRRPHVEHRQRADDRRPARRLVPDRDDGYALDVDGGLFHTDNGGSGVGDARHRQHAAPARGARARREHACSSSARAACAARRTAGQTFDQVRAKAVLRAQLDRRRDGARRRRDVRVGPDGRRAQRRRRRDVERRPGPAARASADRCDAGRVRLRDRRAAARHRRAHLAHDERRPTAGRC